MQSSKSLATVVTGTAGKEKSIVLTFDGRGSQLVMDKILELLQKHQVKAAFFIEGMHAAEDPQMILKIKDAGFAVENYSLHGWSQMETFTADKLIFDFCQSKKIFQLAVLTDSKILKCNETNYTDHLRQAAQACGFQQIVKSDVVVTSQTIKALSSAQAASDYVNRIKPGSIVSVKIKTKREPQTDAKMLPQPVDKAENDLVLAVENLLVAIKKSGLVVVTPSELAEKNRIKDPLTTIYLNKSF